MTRTALLFFAIVVSIAFSGCKKSDEKPASTTGTTPAVKSMKVGLVTDMGGRGDQSFNDSALRGLELWAGGKQYAGSGYVDANAQELRATLPKDLAERTPAIEPVGVRPVVLQSKAQEDYEPNLQLLADQGAQLIIGTGFMLENAIETTAKRNPESKFLLIDSPLLDAQGRPYTLPNVRTVIFKEEEGSFLVGAMAGLVSKGQKVGFVGGMEIPLIKKFEAGFKAGVKTTNPDAQVLAAYTGSFNNVATGKQVAQDLITKGADVVFHAAGTDGLGVIQAVKEARTAGKTVYAIGVDSDQSHVAPDAVLTSMVKRVDLAVYEAARDLTAGKFGPGDVAWGLKEGGVTYAEVRIDFPEKAQVLQKIEDLRKQIIDGRIRVPATDAELASFKP